jgi:hypothetical protein
MLGEMPLEQTQSYVRATGSQSFKSVPAELPGVCRQIKGHSLIWELHHMSLVVMGTDCSSLSAYWRGVEGPNANVRLDL